MLRHTISDAVDEAKLALGLTSDFRLPSTPDASTIVETLGAITAQDRVVLPQTAPPTGSTQPPAAIDPVQLVDRSRPAHYLEDRCGSWMRPTRRRSCPRPAPGGRLTRAWSPTTPPTCSPTPRSGRPSPAGHRRRSGSSGTMSEVDPWELAVLANGQQVPGGGFHVLPEGRPRRYVAFYGHPETVGLGALGDQGPEETLARMQPLLTEYAADGYQVIPTFEMIASVASATATDDSDYSFEWPISTFDAWIEVAQANDMYVILDLQPGREDFLTQAKQYEELLKLPFVGLALDPEWRIGPDQVHLVQTGQVTAAEVNTVVDWLADLVRDNGLPQKMLLVHQFQTRMILDRETLKQRPELQMVIQMDGQGPTATKDDTYRFLTEGTEDAHWRWGWKNFFRMDPETPTPAYTIAKVPTPVYVSYQ